MIDTPNLVKVLRKQFSGTNNGFCLRTDPAYGSIWTIAVYPQKLLKCDIPHWEFQWNPFAHEFERIPLLVVTSPEGIKSTIAHNSGSPYNIRQFVECIYNTVNTGTVTLGK